MRTKLLTGLALAAGVTAALGACAGSANSSRGVKAVVLDEGARQAAQAEAVREADSREGLEAAAATPTTEPKQ